MEISLSIKIFKNVCNLPLRTIGTWVSPKISWKLEIVLTWGQRQVVLHPNVVIFGKMTAFGPVKPCGPERVKIALSTTVKIWSGQSQQKEKWMISEWWQEKKNKSIHSK